MGVIDDATNAAFVLIAALSSTLSPLIFNGLLPARRAPKQTYLLIYGAGDMGLQVARELTEHGERVCLLELGHQLASHARQSGFNVIQIEIC